MTAGTLRRMLIWCAVINYGILIIWFVAFVLAHGWMYELHSRWFRISIEQFDAIHYAGMAIYKVGILLFNVVPFLALCIAHRK
jgi:hypothetical protein